MNKYLQKGYIHKPRWYSFYHQYQNIFNLNPKNVLEIGVGGGIVANILRENNIDITTIDNDPETNPDIIGSVLEIPLKDYSFDMVVAFEILEHLPFESFSIALKEMRRVARKNIIISLPDHGKSLLRLTLKIPFIKEKNIQLRIPAINNKKYWKPSGHHWEMGNIDYSYNKIAKEINNSGLKIIGSYIPNESAWTRYFILKKYE
ncbi:MAG: class I SAM-dependent methyltransferase [Candidatus Pacebacteria bacterium]|nr:class I SAM-dependent methyltransferase [Candidatus Paceibacterota bacterium]